MPCQFPTLSRMHGLGHVHVFVKDEAYTSGALTYCLKQTTDGVSLALLGPFWYSARPMHFYEWERLNAQGTCPQIVFLSKDIFKRYVTVGTA